MLSGLQGGMPKDTAVHLCPNLTLYICFHWPNSVLLLDPALHRSVICDHRTTVLNARAGFTLCRINSDALHSKNAHKEAKDAQDDTHDHKGPHSLKHCCKTNQPEPWWTSEVRLIGGWEAFEDYFKIKIKMLKEKKTLIYFDLPKANTIPLKTGLFFFTKKEKV